ncbi:MAG TPA: glycoside hydrolase family 127 protein [Clostridia bacterium]|nr:glycoside hydrolase family 127 protein [Clostridia bacterium]
MAIKQLTFTPFAHGELKPAGWLRQQLRIQADGLSGNLDKIWPDIRDSQWIGGDRDGWERVPYWLDGFIPLAYLLEDKDLIARAERYVDGILARQEADGWICPCAPEARRTYDVWACILILKVLAMYADLSGEAPGGRVEEAVARAAQCLDAHIRHMTLFNWGSARWFEALIPLFWLYERRPEPWILDAALHLRAHGIDYTKVFGPYRDQDFKRIWTFTTHVVNLGMMLKQEALVSRLLGGDPDEFAEKALGLLQTYHGMACGHFTGDECVAGDSPTQGSELCSVAEAMYSFETLLSVGGNPKWGDALEKLAFNALPATISPDMWTHQYDQMTNQIRCERLPEGAVVFGTNGPESHLFGLEPNFGCCTANFNQGWPKLALHAFMKSASGVASCVIVPSAVSFAHNGARVSVSLETDYPFRDRAKYTVTVDRPIRMELLVRIPAAAKRAFVCGKPAQPGTFHVIDQEWIGTQEIPVAYEFECALADRPRGMYALWRGPLLYSVAIDEQWKPLEYEAKGVERKHPYCDYEISPLSDWAYAFSGDAAATARYAEKPLGERVFDPRLTPCELEAVLYPVDWREENGVCRVRPESDAPAGEARRVRMIPYGATNLRMTEMPVAAK